MTALAQTHDETPTSGRTNARSHAGQRARDVPRPPADPRKATRREWIGLAVIALPCLLYSMDLTVLNLALPTLSAQLKPTSSEQLWIVDIYGFMVAGFLITMGTLGDRIGRRRLLLAGAAAFGVASVCAAFAESVATLIAMRAVLGIAGATLAPSTLSLIRNMFHDEGERTAAVGVWIASFSVGGAIGPLVGGVLLQHFWWGSVFLLAVPVMLLLLALGPTLLPEFRDPAPGRVDLPSAALSLGAVLAVVYGVKQSAEHGITSMSALCAIAGVLLAAVFVRRQGRLAYPMLDLRLFRSPSFVAALLGYALGCFVLFGLSVFIAQYMQLVAELSPLAASGWLAPWGLAFVVGSTLAPQLARRARPIVVMTSGLVVAALGCALLTQVGGPSGPLVIVAGTVFMSLGMAPLFTLGTDLIVGQAPPERAGAAAALSETSSELSGALGIALFGSLGTLVYRTALTSEPPPAVPREVLDAARATLGAAVAVAEPLHEPARIALLAASRTAFVTSLQLTAAIASAITLAAAVMVGRMLRSR